MKAVLVYQVRPGQSVAHALTGDEKIGRDRQVGVYIDHAGISRRHARIRLRGDSWWIEDLGSTNGTFLNGQGVSKERLHHLDVVTLGKAVDLVFLLGEARPVASPSAPRAVDRSPASRTRFDLSPVEARQLAEVRGAYAKEKKDDPNASVIILPEVASPASPPPPPAAAASKAVPWKSAATSPPSPTAAAKPAPSSPQARTAAAPEPRPPVAPAKAGPTAASPARPAVPAEAGPPAAAKPPLPGPPPARPPAPSQARPAAPPAAPAPPATPRPTAAAQVRPSAPAQPGSSEPGPTTAPQARPAAPPRPPAAGASRPPAPPLPARIAAVRLKAPDHQLLVNAPGRYLIGRGPNAALRVDDLTVSRTHAWMVLGDDRLSLTLEDAGSSHGTDHNGVPVQGRVPLANGDSIGIGSVLFEVTIERG